MTVLFDANVILDVLLNREPHALPAVSLFAAVERGAFSGLITATTVPTLYYFANKVVGPNQTRIQIRNLLKLFEIAPVNRAVLEDAFSVRFSDYEDAVIHESARHAGADGIVTRNRQDFKYATLRVYAPDELVQILRTLPS